MLFRSVVEPLSLAYSGIWYLSAFCRLRQDEREFRLDRIKALEVLPTTFDVRTLADNATDAAYNQGQADINIFEADADELDPNAPAPQLTVRLTGEGIRLSAEAKYEHGLLSERDYDAASPRGGIELLLEPDDPAATLRWLLGLGASATIVKPAAAITALQKLAEAAYTHHYKAGVKSGK